MRRDGARVVHAAPVCQLQADDVERYVPPLRAAARELAALLPARG